MILPQKNNEIKSLNEEQATNSVACFKELLKNPANFKNLMIFNELIKPKFDQD